jgi:ATP-dependent exoDNAse (exonuclease V) alpha subunit
MNEPWTPGPWEAKAWQGEAGAWSKGQLHRVAAAPSGRTIAKLDTRNDADARLIAAAPEMAKLIHEAWTWMERANSPDDENQTKEQYRLYILDELAALLSRIRGAA